MASSIMQEGEVALNDKVYKLLANGEQPGRVRRELLSRFPPKQIAGDTSYDNEENISQHIVTDQRGGIGVENFRALPDVVRVWWSNCNLDFAGHIVPGPLATAATLPTLPVITDGGLEAWTTDTNLTSWTEAVTAGGTVTKCGTGMGDTTKYAGTYSACVWAGAGQTASITQEIMAECAALAGKNNSITVYIKVAISGNGTCVVRLTDSIDTTTVSATVDAFTKITVSRTIGTGAAGALTLSVLCTGNTGGAKAYVDAFEIGTLGALGKMINHNSAMYVVTGKCLLKFAGATTGTFLLEGIFPETITDIISTTDTNLVVLQGDSANLWYITSAGVPHLTTDVSAKGTYGVDWAAKFYMITAAGQLKHTLLTSVTLTGFGSGAIAEATVAAGIVTAITVTNGGTGYTSAPTVAITGTGASATATASVAAGVVTTIAVDVGGTGYEVFTNNGKINDGSTIQKMIVYRDAALNEVIYIGTTKGVWVHDTGNGSTTGKFLQSALTMPSHPNACKGMTVHNGFLYASMGLHIKKYSIDGGGAVISSAGLDMDDGVPDEYAGEIIDLQSVENGIFALVSAYETSKRPSSTTDDDSAWATESYSYDGSIATGASAAHIGPGYGSYLQLNVASHKCSQISFYFVSSNASKATIQVYDGTDWTTVMNDETVTSATWITKTFTSQTVTAARIKFYATALSLYSLREFIFGTPRYSTLMYRNEFGWQCRWEDTNHSLAVTPGLASDVYDYRFWWGSNGTIYYITLPRNLQNPKKTVGYQYAASAMHITPWLNAGSETFKKLSLFLSTYCMDLTANETIALKYRINKIYTDRDTGWTTLDTLVLADIYDVKTLFPDSTTPVGTLVKAIQFRFDFARGATTTLAPDLQAFTWGHKKDIVKKYGWNMVLDCREQYGGQTPLEQETSLNAAEDSQTLISFAFRDIRKDGTNTPHYVVIVPPTSGTLKAGQAVAGIRQVTVIEP